MHDVIASSPLIYTHADLKDYGYIYIKGNKPWDDLDFHKDMTIDQFPDAKVFNSLQEAVDELPAFDGETFVMSFEEDGVCNRLWFSKTQKENDLLSRLNRYKMCYGGYGTSIFREE